MKMQISERAGLANSSNIGPERRKAKPIEARDVNRAT
eukprot:CAMPEP_0184490880 /NCGR_PEP_ID=MMETSP0113_2-20130426/19147_1 /TAXON_ID=91329 /ORGANISM="Norrisiella sphaerica, Strain BC52" /LENGTH=36 /DNA_ID= /DNA_START= /DNA_END= /DNA_ORIENTATION=